MPLHLPQKHEKARRELAGGEVEDIDENFIRLYWEQMLQARPAAADAGVAACTAVAPICIPTSRLHQ